LVFAAMRHAQSLSERLGGRPQNYCIAATDAKGVATQSKKRKSDAVKWVRFLTAAICSQLLASAIRRRVSNEFIVSISLLLPLFGKQFE
jgi:hypothetical protein